MLSACHGGGDGKTSEPYHGGDGKLSKPSDPSQPSDPSDPPQSPELTPPKAVQTFEGTDIKMGVYKSGCIKNDSQDTEFYIRQNHAFLIENNANTRDAVKSGDVGSFMISVDLTSSKFSLWVEVWKEADCSNLAMLQYSDVIERDIEGLVEVDKNSPSTLTFKISDLDSKYDRIRESIKAKNEKGTDIYILDIKNWKVTASTDNTESITLSSNEKNKNCEIALNFIEKTKDEALKNYLVRQYDFIEKDTVYESACFNDVCENDKCMFTADPQPQSYKFQMGLFSNDGSGIARGVVFGLYTSSSENCETIDDLISSSDETKRGVVIYSNYGEANKATLFYHYYPNETMKKNHFSLTSTGTIEDFANRYLRDFRFTHTGYNEEEVFNNRLYLLKTKNSNNQEVIYVSLTEDNLNKEGISAADLFTSFRTLNENTYSTIPPLKLYKK